MEPEEVREKINQRILSIEAPTPKVWSVNDREIRCGDRCTPFRVYTPFQGNSLPAVVLIHGGAWVAGNLDTHDHLARYLCSQVGCVVLSVGYTNAPEGKYPLQLEQCDDALNWMLEHAAELSIDPARMAVIGDSAGGNMAAALCLRLRDRLERRFVLQVLINPALDLTCRGTLEQQDDEMDNLRWQAVQYLSRVEDATNPYVSPLMAEDLSGLPSTVVLLAENDELRESGQLYADRLAASGVPTRVYCQRNIGHLAGDGARVSDKAHESIEVAVEALKGSF